MKFKPMSMARFLKRLVALIRQRFFWILTFVGNMIILLGALIIYHLEVGLPGGPQSFIDCLLLSAGLVTTVGYGSYMAITVPGKIAILALMLIGTLFVWIYMAFLVTGLIAPELASLEKDVHDVEKKLHDITHPPTKV